MVKTSKKTVMKTAKKSVKKPLDTKECSVYCAPATAYITFWKRGFTDWRGTSSKSEFWWSYLVNAIILGLFLIMFFVAGKLLQTYDSHFWAFIGIVDFFALGAYSTAIFIPGISMAIRRLHDAGLSGWYILVAVASSTLGFIDKPWAYVIDWILYIVFIVLLLLPTKASNNKYKK